MHYSTIFLRFFGKDASPKVGKDTTLSVKSINQGNKEREGIKKSSSHIVIKCEIIASC